MITQQDIKNHVDAVVKAGVAGNEKAALIAATELLTYALCDLHRIADALEKIASK